MHVSIISIFFKISVTVQTTNIFRANKKTEVSDPPPEACSATHPG